jgi:microsomal dipeptidase-like Zn-dependent dipeptidase
MKKGLIHATLTLVVLGIVALFAAPSILEDQQNVVQRDNEWPLTDKAKILHKSLRIADLHADTLLWKRDLLERSSIGHVDLPRLQDGGVVLQVMSAVTKSPRGQNYESNSASADDNITLLAMLQLWPVKTWDSLLHRALYQSEKLHRAAATHEQLFVITSAAQLTTFLSQHKPGQVATLLATEGAHPLEGSIANLEKLWQAGYRMLGLHHFFDNRLGGSLHGESRQGLTDFGKAVVSAAVEMGFIIDVAHSSPASVDDVLAINANPVVVSHTGIQGTCDSPRNLADEQLQRIAAAGGLVGVGYWDAVCDITPPGVARSIAYAVGLIGAQHVALGSDYDGTTTVTFDTAQLNLLTQALQDSGLSNDDIRLVMGENQLRFLTQHLP